MDTILARPGDSVDTAAYRYYGSNAMLDAVLAQNPHLRRLPVILPAGTVLTMPPLPAAPQTRVRLWD